MIGIPLGIAWANASEWLVHKYLLHGLGKNKNSFWAFHWHEHHATSRKQDMLDEHYTTHSWGWNARTKEIASLVGGAALHLPLLPVAPFFTLTVWACAYNYYRVHRRSHLDPQWARDHLPWHYDHHMGTNQHANWCVTWPLWDHVMGTREKYMGTEKFVADQDRRSRTRAPGNAAPQPT